MWLLQNKIPEPNSQETSTWQKKHRVQSNNHYNVARFWSGFSLPEGTDCGFLSCFLSETFLFFVALLFLKTLFTHVLKAENGHLLRISLKTNTYGTWMRTKQTFALTRIIGVEKSECIITKKCTRQPVLNAKRNAKFHSSQTVQGQYTAESATGNVDHQTDIKQTILLRFKHLFLFCLEFCRRQPTFGRIFI
jgi:hypothetical protein